MAWTNLTFPFGSILPSAKLTQLYNNFAAMAAGQSGAPTLQRSALDQYPFQKADIASNSVGQSELHMAVGSASGTVTANSSIEIAITGPIFFPHIQQTGGTGGPLAVVAAAGAGTSLDPQLKLHNLAGSSATYSIAYARLAGP